MATIVNERDKLLQGASPRDTDPTRGKSLILSSDSPVFHVNSIGTASPSTITVTASSINIPGDIGWTVMSGASNIEVAGDTKSATLAYASMTAASATIRAQINYQGQTYSAYYVVAKVVDGANGSSGLSTGTVFAYKRSAVAPDDNPGGFIFTFASNAITTPAGDALSNGWTKTIPAGADPLYVTVASASGAGATDAVAASEWASPVLFAQNGMNTATIYLYQRAASTPAVPAAALTYTFATGGLSPAPGSWSRTVPGGTNPVYVTTATALSSGATDTIATGEWAVPVILAQNGSNGSSGQRGATNIAKDVSPATAWTDELANAALVAGGYGAPKILDRVTLYNTGVFSTTKFYDGSSWNEMTAFIDGNLLVTGTLSANKITAGTMSASRIAGGTLTGTSINIASGWFRVDTNGNASAGSLTGANLTYDNTANPTESPGAFHITTTTPSPVVALDVLTNSSSSLSHGIRAANNNSGASGLVAAANGRAFHAESGTAGPFTGSHDVALPDDAEIEPGDIVVDVECLLRGGWSNTFFEVQRSSVALQRGALGVYTRNLGRLADYYHMLPMTYRETLVDDGFGNLTGGPATAQFVEVFQGRNVGEVNAVGEGQMNVCGEGGDIEAGDFIVTSSIPGKGMRLAPDTQLTAGLMGALVARAREGVAFQSAAEIKQIACIYISG